MHLAAGRNAFIQSKINKLKSHHDGRVVAERTARYVYAIRRFHCSASGHHLLGHLLYGIAGRAIVVQLT